MAKAAAYLKQVASSNGKVLFVSTKRQAQDVMAQEAKKIGMPYVNKRWPGGMLTNFKTILQSVKRMKHLETFLESDDAFSLKKKERLSKERDLAKLKASFDGIRDMSALPDCLFVIDVGQEHIAVREANKLGIPVVAVVDTNCSPQGVDYVIPGNDDSHKAIVLYCETMVNAMEAVVAKLKKAEETRAVSSKTGDVTVVKKKAAAVESAEAENSDADSDSASSKPQEMKAEKGEAVEEKSASAEDTTGKKVIRVSAEKVKKVLEKKTAEQTEKKPVVKKAKVAKDVDSGKAELKVKKTTTKAKAEKKVGDAAEENASTTKKPAAKKATKAVKKDKSSVSDEKDA